MGFIDSDWGLYAWFEERGVELIHPEDLASFRQLSPYGKVFRRCSSEGPYITLEYAERRFRVKPDLFQPVPVPPFVFGQTVLLKSGGQLLQGKVSDIQWHHGNAKPFFHLSVGGRFVKKRYLAEDLRPAKD